VEPRPDHFVAVGCPATLRSSSLSLAAYLTLNCAAARRGRSQPAGEILLHVGTELEVEAALDLIRSGRADGLWCVEYSAKRDQVRTSKLRETIERNREAFSAGDTAADDWYVVDLGERDLCEREATRLRRVRAGYRSQRRARE